MDISNDVTSGGGNIVTPNPTYAVGAKSFTLQLNKKVDLSTPNAHTTLSV